MTKKLGKTVEIFVEIEHTKHWGVTFWPEKIDWYFPCYELIPPNRLQKGSSQNSMIPYPPNYLECYKMKTISKI